MGRPRRTYGEVAQALRVAADQGPGTAKQLAERAQVGYAAGQYTASRLQAAGELVKLNQGRPAVLGRPTAGAQAQGGGGFPALRQLAPWLGGA